MRYRLTSCIYYLKQVMHEALPGRAVGKLRTVSIDGVPIMLTTTSIQINLTDLPPSLSLPDISDNVEQNYNRHSQIGLEEALSGTERSIDVSHSGIELCNENDHNENKSDPRSPNAKDVLEGDFVKSVAVVLPGLSEPDMAKTNGAPSEQGSQTRQSLQPGEDSVSFSVDTDISKSTDGDDGNNSGKRSARLINKREELGGVSLLRQGDKRSATAVDTRHANG